MSTTARLVPLDDVLLNGLLELLCRERFVVEEVLAPFLPYVPCGVDELFSCLWLSPCLACLMIASGSTMF
jgi:hypothetical protein